MLTRRERDRHRLRHFHPEYVLLVVRDAGRVAVAPLEVNLEPVLLLPVDERVARRIEPRLFSELARSRLLERLAIVLAAGDRLPETGPVRALEQQDLEIRR